MGELGISLGDPDDWALDVLGDILNSFGGRLFDRIRSREVQLAMCNLAVGSIQTCQAQYTCHSGFGLTQITSTLYASDLLIRLVILLRAWII